MAGPLIVRQGNRALSLSFEVDISSIVSEMPLWARERIPSITRNALNDTIKDARLVEIKKIRGVFDRPAPLTQKAPLYRKATKDHLVAEVFIRDEAAKGRPPAKYLQPQVEGGARRAKAFELALRRIGVMRGDEYAVPAIGMNRDAFGNLPGSLWVRILSQLRAFSEVGFKMNETARSRKRKKKGSARYFVPSGFRAEKGIGRLPRGIYERQGNRIRAVVIFVSGAPSYRRRYPFGEAAIAKAQRVFAPYWQHYFYAELAKRTR